jgi:3-oxoacid CoA-transferase
LELIPQGTLAERLRAHAAGIPAFYTPTGASTAVETGAIPIRYNEGGMSSGVRIPGQSKESRIINGRRCLLETAIAGDIALVKAWKVDTEGNCVFRYVSVQFVERFLAHHLLRYAANNFNSVMARNAALTIVEVCL